MNHTPNKLTEIDHIDGESLHNKKENLRLVDRIDNIHNVCVRDDNKSTGIRGISYDGRYNKYTVDFYYNKKRYYFKPFKNIAHAVYLRYLCEIEFLKNIRYSTDDENIFNHINKLTEKEKRNIEAYFLNKIN